MLPPINQRLSQIVDHYTNGNVAAFSKEIDFPTKTLYNYLDINKCIEPSSTVLSKVIETFPAISAEWLLTGKGQMLK